MSLTLDRPAARPTPLVGRWSLRSFGPHWFTVVMGTGIVANAAVTLPVQVPGQRAAALAVWLLDCGLLLALLTASVAHVVRHPDRARTHVLDPVRATGFGAPPMAVMTVGAGAVLVGVDLIGMPAAVALAWSLWFLGTVTGLICAVVVPFVALTRRTVDRRQANGSWLMPVVAPTVSASCGALLLTHTPEFLRETLMVGCLGLVAVSLGASLLILPLIGNRLRRNGIGDAATVPTLVIVVGPLGQSVTALGLLAVAAPTILTPTAAARVTELALVYGVVVGLAALVWLAVAAGLVVRTARTGLPFSMAWWSFTFPVGTVVTGFSGLAARTGFPGFAVVAAELFGVLVLAWVVVLTRTVRGVLAGRLLPGS